jgi:hypothetical protein
MWKTPLQGQRSKTKAIVDNTGRFYRAENQAGGTHLALRWNGRVRFTVPRDDAAQTACWKTFRPGWLEFPLRAKARLPRLSGALSCVETDQLASIREAAGREAGQSCCRTGTAGVWSKDTILFLKKRTAEPLYIVKAGAGEAVGRLLQNEANWLRTLGDQTALADHIPQLVAHSFAADLCLVAERALAGKLDFRFGEPHILFLRKLQEHTRQAARLQESRFYRNIRSRLKDLDGLLSEAWSARLDRAMRRIEQKLSDSPLLLTAAHNDFTPWNIRVEGVVARVFDWEYADDGQLPLIDPLHFVLMPMALKRRPTCRMAKEMQKTLQHCQQLLGKESCYEAQTQALAYLTNLCTFYLWSDRGASESHPVLDSYAEIIDHLCRL